MYNIRAFGQILADRTGMLGIFARCEQYIVEVMSDRSL